MAVSKRLDREIARWEKRADESDQDWESRVYRGLTSAALQLLCTSKALGWGGGVPITDAQMHVSEEARKYPEFFEYQPPAVVRARIPRKRIATAIVRRVFDRDGWECRDCGSHRGLTVDHIFPLVLGGSDDEDNLQTLCGACNSRKGARV